MSQTTDKDSAFKLAQLRRAFDLKLDMEFIENILQAKGDINYRVPKNNEYAGYTALHFAKFEGQDIEIFRQLLRHGADFTIKNESGETVLHNILDSIDTSDDSYNFFWGLSGKLSNQQVHAILSSHLEKSISENPSDKYGLTHFHIACMADHQVAVQMFLDNGVPVDLVINESSPLFPGCTPLDVATRSCALEVLNVLLKYFDDPLAKNKAVMNAMFWLIECNQNIVYLFLIEEKNMSPEIWLSKYKINQAMINALYDSKIDVNITDNGGITAFNYSFNPCECHLFKSTHQHNDLITTFYIHIRKLKYLNLYVNEINRNMVVKANLELNLSDIRMDNFYKEVSQVNAMTFEDDSASFNFKDLLLETGIVVVYPFKEPLRLLIDTFFKILMITWKIIEKLLGFSSCK